MGSGVSRKGDSLTTGHICSTTTTLAKPGQDTVFVNNIRVARKGAPTIPHPFPPSPACANHTAVVNAGSKKDVFCERKLIARITDSADLGALTGGSGDVFAG